MALSAKSLFAKLPKDRREAIKKRTAELVAEEMTLSELRKARKRSQAQVAKKLHIKQAAVSKLERRTDVYVSTLSKTIAAMGGRLEIVATFPDRSPVRITQFGDLAKPKGR